MKSSFRLTNLLKVGQFVVLAFVAVALFSIPEVIGETVANYLSSAPCLLKVSFDFEQGGYKYHNNNEATCFLIRVVCDSNMIENLFIANNHSFVWDDNAHSMHLQSDSGVVFVNMHDSLLDRDTIITGQVRILARNQALDLALLRYSLTPPPRLSMALRYIELDLNFTYRDPIVGEAIAYGGFPLLLGADTTYFHRNEPLVIMGSVAQVAKGRPDFLIQAPTFPGASGSIVISAMDGKFLGITFAAVRKKGEKDSSYESFQFAVKIAGVAAWIKSAIRDEAIRRLCPSND
jgi:hypothetical protein